MLKSGIYQIFNTANRKLYVGSARNIRERWSKHKMELRSGRHGNEKLQRAWNKYGAESFDFILLEAVYCDLLIEREQWYIDNLKPEYNICRTAGSRLGMRHGSKTRAKIGAASRARGAGNKKGLIVSLETRAKISESLRGKSLSAESIAKRERTCRERGWKSRPRPKMSGSRNPAARLTEYDVLSLRRLIEEGVPVSRAAFEIGISETQAHRIKRGLSWSLHTPPLGGV